jgi:hypothetical protein
MQREGGAQVVADVLADLDVLDLAAVDAVQQSAGLLGALGRVRRQIAGTLPARLLLSAQLLDVELLAPAHRAGAELRGISTLTVSTVVLRACSRHHDTS